MHCPEEQNLDRSVLLWGTTLCCTLHEVLCPSLQAPGMSFAGVTSAARGAGVIHPWPPLVPAPFGCPSGGQGRGRLKHLPSTAWGRMNQFKLGVAAVGSHLKLMCVGLAPWVSSLGPRLPGLPSPRQQHLEETGCPFGPKRAMLGLCTLGSSGTCSPWSELTPCHSRTWLTFGPRSL